MWSDYLMWAELWNIKYQRRSRQLKGVFNTHTHTHTHTHTKFTSRNTLTPGLHFQGLDTQHSLREGRQGWIEKLSVSLSHTLTLPEDSVTQNHWEWNGMLKNQLSRSSICLCASETYKWESVKYMTNEVTGSTLCIEELIFEI